MFASETVAEELQTAISETRREAPSRNSPDRQVGVNVLNKEIEAIVLNTFTTTLRSWLFHNGPSGLLGFNTARSPP
jgi:hypothetical protein